MIDAAFLMFDVPDGSEEILPSWLLLLQGIIIDFIFWF